MPAETRLIWIQTATEPGDVYFAECGMYDFEIRSTPDMGYLLRMYQIRPEDSPLLWWAMDGYSLEEAKAKAERLADQHMPPIIV
jgi:hypothetical protein